MAHDDRYELVLGRQGRVVIPAAVRRRLGLETGDELVARVEGQRLVLQSAEATLRALQAEFREARGSRSIVDELIAERRREYEQELGALQ